MKRSLLLLFVVLLGIKGFAQPLDTLTLYRLEKASKKINSSYHEGAPVISPDGKTLYFFRTNHPRNRFGKEGTQDIWFSKKDANGNWTEAQNIGNVLNRYPSNQVMSVVNDGKTLLISGGKNKKERGLALSHKKGSEWSKPVQLEIPDFLNMNKGKFYGASMTNDMEVIIHYFSTVSGQKYSDLYISFKESELVYSKPVKLGLSTAKDDFSPFISEDNKTLYFASNRDGGLGDADIWVTTRTDDTWLKWSKPTNLGAPVNTRGFDAYFTTDASWKHAYTTRSYMSADGGSLDVLDLTLRPTLHLKGRVMDKYTHDPIKADIQIEVIDVGYQHIPSDSKGKYKTKVKDRGLFLFYVYAEGYQEYHDTLDLTNAKDVETITKNFYLAPVLPEVYIYGHVYNKKTNEPLDASLTFKTEHHPKVFTESAVKNGFYEAHLHDIGDYHIIGHKDEYYDYSEHFNIPKGKMIVEVEKDIYIDPKEKPILLHGTVTDEKTGDPLKLIIKYLSPTGKKRIIKTNEDGYYEAELPEPGLYKFYTGSEGYLTSKDTTTVYVPLDDKMFSKDISLTPIEIGVTVRLNEIYFDFDRSKLRPASFPELNRVVEFMELNANLVIEISGHTDDRGSDDYNLKLSDDRAKSVRTYLLKKGVDENRIVAKGYGETKPVVANDSDSNRQFNRRVEFTVLKK